MALHDYICLKCEYMEERTDGPVQCPNCGEEMLTKIWLTPPMMRMGGSQSDRSIASMQKSFRERFKKKELDDLRHRFGKEYDDSLKAGEIKRIKKKLGENT